MPGPEESHQWVTSVDVDSEGRSKGVRFSNQEELTQGYAELQDRKRAERQARLAIPEDVKPGTATKVWYELRNAEMVNREAAEAGTNPEVSTQRADLFNLEMRIIDGISDRFKRNATQTTQDSGSNPSAEQMRQMTWNLPAHDAAMLLDNDFINFWQDLQAKGETTSGFRGGQVHPISELIKAGTDLRGRLMSEEGRTPPNPAPTQTPK